jgi:hypothetical protein
VAALEKLVLATLLTTPRVGVNTDAHSDKRILSTPLEK